MTNNKELLEEIMWGISFHKEDIAAERYSKETNIKILDGIQDKLNELYRNIIKE